MKLVSIVGARPQFIKAAPVKRAIESHNSQGRAPRLTEILVHTGQHYDYDMSQTFFDQPEIPKPKYHLEAGSGNHGEMTGRMLARIEAVLLEERPDWVLVYGDTNSTVAGALAAVKIHIPVAHVEAGLRSYNRRMPEEINRVITDHISSLLFCPKKTAVMNLKNEGITEGVSMVGDVMYGAFLLNKELSENISNILSQLELVSGSYCLATVHRQENTEEPGTLLNIFTAFEELSSADCPFIILLHPRTRKALQRHKEKDRLNPHVQLLPPARYLDMIALEAHAKVILTDSGGVQKEAYFPPKVPCVALRDETEWVETVEAGWDHIGGADCHKIVSSFEKASNSIPKKSPKLYGESNASDLVLHNLISTTVQR